MNDACAVPVSNHAAVVETLLQPGRNCCSVARARRASVIVDAEAYFLAFAQAAERAERSILILAWDFNSRTLLSRDESSPYRQSLGEFLNRLARRKRQLHIHILDWDFPLVFGTDREISPLYGLTWKPHRRIHFRYDGSNPIGGSHHQKIVVIDDRLAFIGGLDLTLRRWDTPQHRPTDTRRVEDGKPYPPFHDVMMAVDASVARALGDIARRRWKLATGESLAPTTIVSDPWPSELDPDFSDVDIGIACTAPASEGSREVRDIEQLYLDMIERAQRYIYIENQYFTSNKICAALADRLAEPDGPEVVVVSRLLSHGWLEEMTMQLLRTRVVRELRTADRHNRFNIYCPHVAGLAPNTCVDLHSKVMIVDDAWLRVGSANVSNRSMGLDSECDVVIEAGGSAAVAKRIRGIRDALLAEHLGVPTEEFAMSCARVPTLHAAIERHRTGERTLKPLQDTSEWPEPVVSAAAIGDPERPVSIDALVEELAPVPEKGSRLPWGALAAACAVLLGLALAWRYTPLADLTSAQVIVTQVENFAEQWWAPLLVIAAYTPASIVMFPRPLITVAAVIAFGSTVGFAYAMLGILTAALAGYAAGRGFSRDTVRSLTGTRLNRLSRALRRKGLLAMVLVRLVPIAPFIVVSLVAGAIRIKTWHFALGTGIGMLPGLLAATVIGQQLVAGLHDPEGLNYSVLGGLALALLLGAYFVQRWLRRMQ